VDFPAFRRSLFNHLDYSFSPGHEDGSDAGLNGPGGGSAALRKQIGILSRFLQAFPLVNMAPDARTVLHAAGVYARALSSPGGEYAIYLDGNGPSTLRLALPAGEYTGWWFDVRTGAQIMLQSFRHAGGEKALDTMEFRNGIALRLTRTAGTR
jgi:hypothetical protein